MKILLATGGSGGHIFPAIRTAEHLRRQGHQVSFAGALTSVRDRLTAMECEHFLIDVEGFRASSALRFLVKMIGAVSQCTQILHDVRPDVVVGFGSYSSFPLIFAANRIGIRTLLHEQNVIPGKANRLSARFTKTVAVTFEETRKYFPRHSVVWTGCPCNSAPSSQTKDELLSAFGLREGRRTILVLGGSQGSHCLNQVFFESLAQLENIQVIHMTGKTDFETYREKYGTTSIPYHVCAFINDIQGAYTVADIVIARAGAATVCELAAFGIPSILIPYPYAQGHQRANADILERAGKAVVIEQSSLSVEQLVRTVKRVLNDGFLNGGRISEYFVSNPVEKLADAISARL